MIEYSTNYFDTTGSLWFYSKDETDNFDADIRNTHAFKSSKEKGLLIDNTVAYGNNSILKMHLLLCSLEVKVRQLSWNFDGRSIVF